MSEFLKKRQATAPGNKPEEIPPGGLKLGTLEGRKLRVFHPGLGGQLEVVEAGPPLSERRGMRWWSVSHYNVKQLDGRVAWIVCFSCDSGFTGRWLKVDTEAGPELRPLLDGGMVNVGGSFKACTCSAGQRWLGTFRAATNQDCDAAERYRAELTQKGQELLKARAIIEAQELATAKTEPKP